MKPLAIFRSRFGCLLLFVLSVNTGCKLNSSGEVRLSRDALTDHPDGDYIITFLEEATLQKALTSQTLKLQDVLKIGDSIEFSGNQGAIQSINGQVDVVIAFKKNARVLLRAQNSIEILSGDVILKLETKPAITNPFFVYTPSAVGGIVFSSEIFVTTKCGKECCSEFIKLQGSNESARLIPRDSANTLSKSDKLLHEKLQTDGKLLNTDLVGIKICESDNSNWIRE